MIRGGAVILDVSDVGRSVRFYVETLGMKLVREAANGRSAVIDAGEGFLIGLRASDTPSDTPSGGAGPTVHLYPKVPIGEAIAIYENRGVTFTVEETTDAIVARFRDPDAIPLCLVQEK